MTNRLKIGIIGLGGVAELHLEAYQELLDEIEIVAGADVKMSRLDQLASRFGFRPYTDYRNMFRSETLDIACVLTPAATHAEITGDCARAGVHVLCEKPLAINMEAAKQMITVCRETGVRLCYGASYRFLPAIRKARELIRSGVIGDVLLLREQAVGGMGPESHEFMGFAHYPRGGPGGSGMGLVDHGIHLIDTFAWLVDCAAESAFGRGDISGQEHATEYIHINFRNGAVGQLLYDDGTFPTDLPTDGIFSRGSGWTSGGYVQRGRWAAHPGCIHVHGTKGALRIFHYADALFLVTKSGMEQVFLADHAAPGHFALQLKTFVRNINENQATEVPGEVGLAALRVLRAAYESSETGKLVIVGHEGST